MERNYPQRYEICQLKKTGADTIQFLLQYSGSLRVLVISGVNIEIHLN